MPEPTLVAIGLVLGALFAWLVARAHFDARGRARRRELDARIKELETLESERRRQLAERTQELAVAGASSRPSRSGEPRPKRVWRRSVRASRNSTALLEEAEVSLRDTFDGPQRRGAPAEQRRVPDARGGAAGPAPERDRHERHVRCRKR